MLDKKYEERRRLGILNRIAKRRRKCIGELSYHELPKRAEDGSKGYWQCSMKVYVGDVGDWTQLSNPDFYTEVDSQGLRLYTTTKEHNDNLVAQWYMFKRAAKIHCNKQTRKEARNNLLNIERKVKNRLEQKGQIKSTKFRNLEIENAEMARSADLKREGVPEELISWLINNNIIKGQRDLNNLDSYQLMQYENEMNDIG